ncbi:hypothetical protein PoB_006503200 [Plakobranchus ocellatus]|uniref:Uncharacterized protein n=1 Tax=Plakobranchus ocellatus TaxID=259542 RepID=A0AAV4D2W8_9GAST|nr:hypothetical protein PoB_006503200 [Plakobranchus ocellatus]
MCVAFVSNPLIAQDTVEPLREDTKVAPTLRQGGSRSRLGVRLHHETRVFHTRASSSHVQQYMFENALFLICQYVTTHNFTDRCRAKNKASLVMQNIWPTCNSVAHSYCDISPTCRLLQVASPPVWAYAKRRPTLEATRLVMANS